MPYKIGVFVTAQERYLPGGGRNKKISENEEKINVFYCLALKNEEEIRKRWGKKRNKEFLPTYLPP